MAGATVGYRKNHFYGVAEPHCYFKTIRRWITTDSYDNAEDAICSTVEWSVANAAAMKYRSWLPNNYFGIYGINKKVPKQKLEPVNKKFLNSILRHVQS